MSSPSTKTIDHIVHLTPPGTVEEVSRQFRHLGFNVIPGGTHAGGLTANALVILSDGAYLELISFTHPPSHYPPGSSNRQRRDSNPWASKSPGWIDFAFLGSSTTSISRIINERAEAEGSGIRYAAEVEGGRTRGDGKVLKWAISAVDDEHAGVRGSVPFFCGDVTPRSWRVPVEPLSNSVHPSGVRGIAHVRILAKRESLDTLSVQLTSIIGDPPVPAQPNRSTSEYIWTLETPTPSSTLDVQKPRLILSEPKNDEEKRHLAKKDPGIFEVAFSVGPEGVERESMTPYGKILWLRS